MYLNICTETFYVKMLNNFQSYETFMVYLHTFLANKRSLTVLKETGSPDGLGFCCLVLIDLGLNKSGTWFSFFWKFLRCNRAMRNEDALISLAMFPGSHSRFLPIGWRTLQIVRQRRRKRQMQRQPLLARTESKPIKFYRKLHM
jgi:hypothetical protein